MKYYDGEDIIGIAVHALRKPAVYVVNHDSDETVFMKFVREVNKRYEAGTCRTLIDDTFDEGLVTFDTAEEAVEFYEVFETEGIFNTGLMATMYDMFGNHVNTNVGD